MNTKPLQDTFDGIAIIGMAGRFPGAKNPNEFWQNLKAGKEGITFFSKEDARSCGIEVERLNDPNYVLAGGLLEDIELFDAGFFGLNPREAENLDPQQRLFMECSYEALEDAGYAKDKYEYPVGVYAGSNMSYYFLYHLFNKLGIKDDLAIAVGNDKDYVANRVSYEFNLRGPSINIQTSCSTSMTAIAMAYEGLLNYHCDMALAGGAGVRLPQKAGYLYQTGFIGAPDGHTKPFDADANGTVFTSAVGVVLMKRLEDAINDGDHIYAVIRGMAVNNDGSAKVGFTAPSREGQAEVIAAAQNLAGVNPEDISYIETHGTGTSLGDPIEIAALNQVFEAGTSKKSFCAIGSVKGNIGHAISGAGVAAIIKTAMALEHRQIPPSINFKSPNPKIDFENSAFYVNSKLSDWETNGKLRIAGVSSFGFGGTNVHAVLSEAPLLKSGEPINPWQLITLSAMTPETLNKMRLNLAEYFRKNPQLNLADAAYTLHVGRKEFQYRQAFLCSSVDDAVRKLETNDGADSYSGAVNDGQTDNKAVKKSMEYLKQASKENLIDLAKLWVEGTSINWEEFHRGEYRLRISLPTYPFERKRYWVEQYRMDQMVAKKKPDQSLSADYHNWVYFPTWKRTTSLSLELNRIGNECWMLFGNDNRFSSEFVAYLNHLGVKVITIGAAEQYMKINDQSFTINPGLKDDYRKLIAETLKTGESPKVIVHLWNLTSMLSDYSKIEFSGKCQTGGFYSLINFAQALGEAGIEDQIRIAAITNNMHCISAAETVYPEKATILGPCKVIPREYPHISCQSIDLTLPETEGCSYQALIERILAEITAKELDFVVALRGLQRWVQNYERIELRENSDDSFVKEGGTYLITGGMGGLGIALASYMASKAKVKLVLTRRSAFPDQAEWGRWLNTHAEHDKESRKIRQLQAIENMGSEVMVVNADTSDLERMRQVNAMVEAKFGKIDGLIHAAGIADNGLIGDKSLKVAAKVLAPKVQGTLVLDEIFANQELDFMLLFSSSSAILGNAGFVDYCAANNFLDAYAQSKNSFSNTYTVSINWDEWDETGMAAESKSRDRVRNKIPLKEGLALLDQIMKMKPAAQVVVSPGDFLGMLENIREYLQTSLHGQIELINEAVPENNRPNLQTPYMEPNNETEAVIVDIWQRLLGVHPVGINDDFFDLGGHSLLATTLITELAKKFHQNITLQNLFEKATVAELAAMLEPEEESVDDESQEYEEGQI